MKIKGILLLSIFLFFSCNRTSNSVVENHLNVKLPKKFIILKDTLIVDQRVVHKMDLQYTKKQIYLLVHKLKRKENLTLTKFDKGYELSFVDQKNKGDIIIKIDTINNHFLYREYYFQNIIPIKKGI